MRCYDCGGYFVEHFGALVLHDNVIGDYVIDNVAYRKCDNCGELLFPDEAWKAADQEYERVKEELIGKLPIGEFIFAADAYSILNITRQAFHKNRRIKNGFIHSKSMNGRKVYHKRSVELFAESGDGRFPLIIKQDEKEKEYIFVSVPYLVCQNNDHNDHGELGDMGGWRLMNNSTPRQWYDA